MRRAFHAEPHLLPFRRGLPPSALVAGATVPDLPYYLPLPFSSRLTHFWQGVALDLPVGLAALAVFHLVLRAPLTALAPDGLRARLPDRAALGVAVPPPLIGIAACAATGGNSGGRGGSNRAFLVQEEAGGRRVPIFAPGVLISVGRLFRVRVLSMS